MVTAWSTILHTFFKIIMSINVYKNVFVQKIIQKGRENTPVSKIISKIDNQLCRYILVGSINTLFSCFLYLILSQLGFYYIYALSITWCVGMLFSFKATGKWVFKNNDKALLIKFVALYCVIYLISIGLLKGCNSFLNNSSLSGIITILITSGLSFLGNKHLVFITRQHKK
ncbi:GtrA family protein [Legionella longbeachae]|uniref:Putative O antigen biosynthesis protein n=2 Tax=Legionella longbeachae TaxID=450 RepID=D3HNT6_LEGLN|nr:GtrA family protein [Legionella longbeachae]CBJ10549.1 putative O antigen biosynthesis protein [Legionella longbeachae NSW150]ARM34280.1 GtrA family protein [Legionella longbeachae]QIN31033.1 GtrA family protein [Legionella longbeachae]QIN34390.1 GtrA family protein [Legionella longbeachae]